MQNSNSLKTINIIYLALIGGQLMFMAVAFFAANEVNADTQSINETLQLVIPFVVLGGLSVSSFVFKSLLDKIDKKAAFDIKINSYRGALIVRYALLEGPSLLAIVGYLFTQNPLFLGMSGIMILAFLYFRPTRDKIAQDLELSSSEAESL